MHTCLSRNPLSFFLPRQQPGLTDIALRRTILDAALDWSKRLGLKLDTVYDALQLVQRCSAAGGGGGAPGGGGDAPGLDDDLQARLDRLRKS